jgi:hypothetical protein
VAYSSGRLFIADTYNHKIKEVDPAQDKVRTLLGDGRSGDRDEPPRFYEPGGLSVAGETLYVADTNNHRIRTIDLKTGKVTTLGIAGLSPPTPAKPAATDDTGARKPIPVAAQRIAPGKQVRFEATLQIPDGYKLNPLAPLWYRLTAAGEQSLIAAANLGERNQIDPPPEGMVVKFSVPQAATTGKAEFKVTLSYGYCRDGAGGLCKLGTLTWLVPIEIAADVKQSVIKLTPANE